VKWRLDKGQIEVVDDAVAEILRRKTPAERVQMALDINRRVRLRIEANLRKVYPAWDDDKVQTEMARRMLLASADSPSERIRLAEIWQTIQNRRKS
jgi:hypothetical protein